MLHSNRIQHSRFEGGHGSKKSRVTKMAGYAAHASALLSVASRPFPQNTADFVAQAPLILGEWREWDKNTLLSWDKNTLLSRFRVACPDFGSRMRRLLLISGQKKNGFQGRDNVGTTNMSSLWQRFLNLFQAGRHRKKRFAGFDVERIMHMLDRYLSGHFTRLIFPIPEGLTDLHVFIYATLLNMYCIRCRPKRKPRYIDAAEARVGHELKSLFLSDWNTAASIAAQVHSESDCTSYLPDSIQTLCEPFYETFQELPLQEEQGFIAPLIKVTWLDYSQGLVYQPVARTDEVPSRYVESSSEEYILSRVIWTDMRTGTLRVANQMDKYPERHKDITEDPVQKHLRRIRGCDKLILAYYTPLRRSCFRLRNALCF